MAEQYLPDFGIDAVPPFPAASEDTFDRERLKFLLIGSPAWIQELIHQLHQSNIIEAGLWSRLVPAPDPGERVSIVMLYRRRR